MTKQSDKTVPVIAIDGPSGAGKGTICTLIAKHLGFHLLESGAVYRALAYWAWQQQLDISQTLTHLIQYPTEPLLEMQADIQSGHVRVMVNHQDVTDFLHSEECGMLASKLAKHQIVRSKVIELQRACARLPGLVADGRDMSSVVFPEAQLKIFLTADIMVRAERRYQQLQKMGLDASLRTVLDEMRWRDEQDRCRVIAPLIPDPAAVILDTTKLSIAETVQRVLALAAKVGIGV